jgi:hypothetical protein
MLCGMINIYILLNQQDLHYCNTQLYTMRGMVLPEDELKIFDGTLEMRYD